MSVRLTTDPAEFKATTFPFLRRDPVLNSYILSNTEDRISGILHDPAPPVFLSIHDETTDEVLGAVFCTALRGIQLGALSDALVPAIVDACAARAPNPDVIAGTASAALLLTELLAARSGKTFRQTTGMRLHKLGTFVEQHANGTARQAVAADVEVVVPLLTAYGIELGHPLPPDEQYRWVRTRIERGRLWLWEDDGHVVSVVGHQQTLFNSTRVGPVYTPPFARGHGYASALTAHVTRLLQAAGSEVCLNTDLANPTSNKIYAAIGYRPLNDFIVYELT
ncbi:GNAT family N-acetyltransferase [Kribbella sp. NPDC051620]|uniref:GNAT family N-acetyltransferase n=1 Tax=Kribbella sp. NPDC051620 TaxID=3364120 RepID=UPI0037A1FB3F